MNATGFTRSFIVYLESLESQCKKEWSPLLKSLLVPTPYPAEKEQTKEKLTALFIKAISEINTATGNLDQDEIGNISSEIIELSYTLSILNEAELAGAEGLQKMIFTIKEKVLGFKPTQRDNPDAKASAERIEEDSYVYVEADAKSMADVNDDAPMNVQESGWEDYCDQGQYAEALNYIVSLINPENVSTHLCALIAKLIDRRKYEEAIKVILEMRTMGSDKEAIDSIIELFPEDKQEDVHKVLAKTEKDEGDLKSKSEFLGLSVTSPQTQRDKMAKYYPNARNYLNVAIAAMNNAAFGTALKKTPITDKDGDRIISLLLVGWIFAGADSEKFPEICSIAGLESESPGAKLSALCKTNKLNGEQLGRILIGMPDPKANIEMQVATSISEFRRNSSLPLDELPTLFASALRAPASPKSLVDAAPSVQNREQPKVITNPFIDLTKLKNAELGITVIDLISLEMYEEAFAVIKRIPNSLSHPETIKVYNRLTSEIAKKALDTGNLTLALKASGYANKESLDNLLALVDFGVIVNELRKIALSNDPWDRKTALNLLAFYPEQLSSLDNTIFSALRQLYNTEWGFDQKNPKEYQENVAMIRKVVESTLEPLIVDKAESKNETDRSKKQ